MTNYDNASKEICEANRTAEILEESPTQKPFLTKSGSRVVKALGGLALAALFLVGATGCSTQTPPPAQTQTVEAQTPTQTPDVETTSPVLDEQLDIENYRESNKQKIVDTLNNSSTSTLYGRTLDSENELNSISFRDFYFIDKNQELNGNSNFVVRYTLNYDELKDETSMISLRYNLPQDMLYDVAIDYSDSETSLPDLLDYLYENRDVIQENGYNLDLGTGVNADRAKDGAFLSCDADTFHYYFDSK